MSNNLKGCFLHETDHWQTPKKMYNRFMELGYIDPCPYHCGFDNLGNIYKNKKLFINPPYSQCDKWVDFAIKNYQNGCLVMLLIPARTDTKYFHKLLSYFPIIYFIKGRLHFNDSKSSAPFPSLLICLDPSCDFKFPCWLPYVGV